MIELKNLYFEEKKLPFLIINIFNKNDMCLITTIKNLLFCLYFLKEHIGFQYKLLSCISGVDLLKSRFRFSISYELLSIVFNSKLRIKIFVEEFSIIPSIVSIYKNSIWWEREVWDMFGLFFENNLDLRRILTDYGFEGYPLRKDFPLSGLYELAYDLNFKKIISTPVYLSQKFRFFNYETPW